MSKEKLEMSLVFFYIIDFVIIISSKIGYYKHTIYGRIMFD